MQPCRRGCRPSGTAASSRRFFGVKLARSLSTLDFRAPALLLNRLERWTRSPPCCAAQGGGVRHSCSCLFRRAGSLSSGFGSGPQPSFPRFLERKSFQTGDDRDGVCAGRAHFLALSSHSRAGNLRRGDQHTGAHYFGADGKLYEAVATRQRDKRAYLGNLFGRSAELPTKIPANTLLSARPRAATMSSVARPPHSIYFRVSARHRAHVHQRRRP